MRRKLTKGVKWLCLGLTVMSVILLLGYFIISEYYLPRYFQNKIIPELVKDAGIKGFSGRVSNVGAFGADLGEMVIGSPNNPTLRAKRVTMTYSLQESWQRGHLVVEEIVVSGVKLRCSMRNGKLIINGVNQEKFIAEIKKHFIRPKQKRLLSVNRVTVRQGELDLKLGKKTVTVPFNLRLQSVNRSWHNLQAELKVALGKDTVTAAFDCNLEQGTLAAEFKGSGSLKQIAHLINLARADILPADGIYEGRSDFAGKMDWQLKPTFRLRAFNLAGTVRRGIIDTGYFVLRAPQKQAGKQKEWSYSLSRKNGRLLLELSNCLVRHPFNAKISTLTLEIDPVTLLPRRLSGRLQLPLQSLPVWRTIGINPLYNIEFDSYCQGEFKPQDNSWQFSLQPWRSDQTDRLYEWFFKADDNYLFATIKRLRITGRGNGCKGEVGIIADLPEVNLSGFRKAVGLKKLTLKEKMQITFTPQLKLSVQHIAGKVAIASGDAAWQDEHWSGSAIEIGGQLTLAPDLRRNHGKIHLTIDRLKRQNEGSTLATAALDAHGEIEFALHSGSGIALKSLDGELTMDSLDCRTALWELNFSKLNLRQRLKFDHGIVVARGTSQLAAENCSLSSGGGKITWWKVAADSTVVPSDQYPPADRLLQSIITFRKAVFQANTENARGGTAAGELRLQLPLSDNCVSGSIKLNGRLKQGGYFAADRKWRAVDMAWTSDISLDSGSKQWPGAEAMRGTLQCGRLELSAGNYYLKISDIKLLHRLLLGRNRAGLPIPVTGKLKFTAAQSASGYMEKLLNATMLAGTIDYEQGRKPYLKASLQGKKFAMQSVITGNCTIPNFKVQSSFSDKGLIGSLQLQNAAIKLPGVGISGRGISLTMPLGWPRLPTGKSGKLQATAISWNGLSFANMELSLDSNSNALMLKGSFTNNISSQADNFCFGKIVLPPAELQLDLDFSLPAYTIAKPINLGRFIPDWDGLKFSGTMAAKANISYSTGKGLRWQSSLTLKKAALRSARLQIDGLNTTLTSANYNCGLATDQLAKCDTLRYGDVVLTDAEFRYSIDANSHIKIGQNSFRWLGSEAFVRPFRLQNEFTAESLEAYCRKLPVAALLKFLGLQQVKCRGNLRGTIKAALHRGKLTIDKAELSSMPEQAQLLQIADLPSLIRPPQNSVQDFTCQLLQTGFLYNWLKVDFAVLPQYRRITLAADGKAVAPPPFIYNYDHGSFTRCPAGKGNVAGELAISTTITLPRRATAPPGERGD